MPEDFEKIGLDRREITVALAGAEKIRALVKEYQVCELCRERYTEANPCVLLNTCLTCFYQKHRGLRYVGPRPGEEGTYIFLDVEKYVTFARTTDRQPARYTWATIDYYGYHRPPDFDPWHWRIMGTPGGSAIVLLWFHASEGVNSPQYLYLCYKDGSYEPLERRKKATRDMLAQARARAEQTKDSAGNYHLPGSQPHATYTDEDLYRLIAQIKSEEFDRRPAQLFNIDSQE
jgi:hypothetical protein